MSVLRTTTPPRVTTGSAGVAAVTSRSHRPPCADGPNDWDLDAGTPESWRTAVQVCRSCPLLSTCQELAQVFIARGEAPRAVIWAGVAYDNAGRVVDDLDRHRVMSIDQKRPMRITRIGAEREHVEASHPTPKRLLVLGHPIRPTSAI